MRRFVLAIPVLAALWPLAAIAASPSVPPLATPTSSPSPSATPSPSPSATPTPSAGSLSLSPTLGPADTTITVEGAHFRSGEPVTLYWDSPTTSFGQATADGQGGFKIDVKARAGDVGQHMICAVEPGPQQPCAVFKLEAAPSPSPSASPSPTPSATPSLTATPPPAAAPSAAPNLPITDQPTAVAALLQPPFVLFPALVLFALVGGCVYWIWIGTRRRPAAVAAATVVHRSIRPGPTAATAPADPTPPPATAVEEPRPPAPADLPAPRPAADDALDFPQPGD